MISANDPRSSRSPQEPSKNPNKKARSFLVTQIKESKYYRQECKRLGIDFFDFTEFSEGSNALRAHFENWLQGY